MKKLSLYVFLALMWCNANKAKRYPEEKIKKARDTLREILKVYHYESGESNVSKDVVIELESLVGYLK